MNNELNNLTHRIIAAAIEVHRELGPGLLESVYEYCLVEQLRACGLTAASQVLLPIYFKGKRVPKDFRIDILVEEKVIIEIKAVEAFNPIYQSQLITYLKLSGREIGLIINFNVQVLHKGVTRCFHPDLIHQSVRDQK